MNKVKYDLRKILLFPLVYYFFNTVYLFYIKKGVLNYGFFSGFIILTIVMVVVSIMIWKVFRDENKNDSGLYFSLTDCRIIQENKIDKFIWSDIRTTSTLKIWNFFYIIKFSSVSSDFTYRTSLFFPVSESFIGLVKTYVPVDHELHQIIKNYSGED